jgi:hypothetical protein
MAPSIAATPSGCSAEMALVLLLPDVEVTLQQNRDCMD